MDTTPAQHPLPIWNPSELGAPRATAASIILVVTITAFFYWAAEMLKPKTEQPPIQVTQAQLVQLPAPAPPPPPKVVPPPKPVPAVIPKPPPVASKIVVAVKPPPPIHHVMKPVPRPIIHHVEAPPRPVAHPSPTPAPPQPVHAAPTPAAPPAPPRTGIPIYGREMHAILEQDQNVPQALEVAGVSGTTIIRIIVAPDGHVVSASIVHSSGIALIDKTALQHVMEAHFTAFTSDMPSSSLSFEIPVNIAPQGGGSDSDSDSGSD